MKTYSFHITGLSISSFLTTLLASRKWWTSAVTIMFLSLSLYAQTPDSPVMDSKRHGDEFNRALPIPVRVTGEYRKLSAVLLSANELVHFHPQLFAELVSIISEKVPVIAIVAGPEQVLNAREALEERGVSRERVHFLIYQLDSMWIRDFGPLFIRRSDGSALLLDTYYRARDGNEHRTADDQFPFILANALNLPCAYVPIALEGGNFVHNGVGFGVSSYKLVERNEFRNFGGNEFSLLFSQYFALKSMTFVPSLPGEPTGHVDMFMTFLGPRIAVVAEADESYPPEVRASLERTVELLGELLVDGLPIEIRRLPLPPRLDGFWRSYTNVFYVNGLLLVPGYSDVDPELQEQVIATYQSLLPDWEIKMIPANDLVEIGGFLHCLTLGIPHYIDPSRLLEYAE